MLFNSAFFLFGFIPIFFLFYFGVVNSTKAKNYTLIAASIFFYSWAEPTFVFWILGSALLDWFIGNEIYKATQNLRWRKLLLVLGVANNLGLLIYFKYANFFVDSVSQALVKLGFTPIALLSIALPIGISFVVFEKITYLVDIYRHQGLPSRNFSLYLLYVFFFPKLLAGPIIKYRDIEAQLTGRTVHFEDIREGTIRFLYGLGKKVLIADHLSRPVNAIFHLDAEKLNCSTAWIGILCFSAQIYFDFSGYSDMAIGLSRIMGFRLLENFRMPYTSVNFTDFWRRWHISLSSWIRDYLYIPLGGNRCSSARSYFNLCICFFLSGLWHGAAWNFICWGIFHGIMLILDRLFWIEVQKRLHLPRLFNIFFTFGLVMISWVIFRAESFSQVLFYIQAMFSPGVAKIPHTVWISPDIMTVLIVAYIIIWAPLLPRFERLVEAYHRLKLRSDFELASVLILFFLTVSKMASDTFNAFIYFRF